MLCLIQVEKVRGRKHRGVWSFGFWFLVLASSDRSPISAAYHLIAASLQATQNSCPKTHAFPCQFLTVSSVFNKPAELFYLGAERVTLGPVFVCASASPFLEQQSHVLRDGFCFFLEL